MIQLQPKDTLHKAQLLRLLAALLDDRTLSSVLYFKGGTAAALLGWLDRFSVDLDFDLKDNTPLAPTRARLHTLFGKLGLRVSDESTHVLSFVLKYESLPEQRNTIHLDALATTIAVNRYVPLFLAEIDRTARCQSQDTAVAHKLVALTDRYTKHGSIAGRDVYDIHHFLLQGYAYNHAVIMARTGKSVIEYLHELVAFIEKNVTQTIINQDLNTLLTPIQFTRIRTILKQETLMLLQQEIARLSQ